MYRLISLKLRKASGSSMFSDHPDILDSQIDYLPEFWVHLPELQFLSASF